MSASEVVRLEATVDSINEQVRDITEKRVMQQYVVPPLF
jgi:hypothetical protein